MKTSEITQTTAIMPSSLHDKREAAKGKIESLHLHLREPQNFDKIGLPES